MITIFRLICHQMKFLSVLNQSEKSDNNPNLVSFNKIETLIVVGRFLSMKLAVVRAVKISYFEEKGWRRRCVGYVFGRRRLGAGHLGAWTIGRQN